MIRVEFYGIPRVRTGVPAVELAEATTLGDALRQVAARFPPFAADCLSGEQLNRNCIASLNGARFVSDPATPLEPGQVLLILSADAGG